MKLIIAVKNYFAIICIHACHVRPIRLEIRGRGKYGAAVAAKVVWIDHSICTSGGDVRDCVREACYVRCAEGAGHGGSSHPLHEDGDAEYIHPFGYHEGDGGVVWPGVVCSQGSWDVGGAKFSTRLVYAKPLKGGIGACACSYCAVGRKLGDNFRRYC